MKRFIKWFREWVSPMDKGDKISLVMAAGIGLFVCIFLFVSTDIVPATASDYEPMEKQVIAIQQNPTLIYEKDCNITVNNDIITVSFINDECKLNARYNQNFELLSTQKEEGDNYMAWWFALPVSILIGFAALEISAIILRVLINTLEELWKLICKKKHSVKEKS